MPRAMTQDEIHTARLYRKECKSLDFIAQRMGRSRSAIVDAVKGHVVVNIHEGHQSQMKIPDYVLADRDRRLALQYKDLTAMICGDPLR